MNDKIVSSTSLWLIGGVSTAVFAALTWLVLSGVTQQFDESLLLGLNELARGGLDSFFVLFTELGGTVVLTLATALLVTGLLMKKRYRKAGFVAVAVGGSALLNLIFKGVFERVRPELWERLVEVSNYSYPSGHALSSSVFAITIIALVWHTKWRTLAVVMAAVYVVMIGVSRMYLGVHYATDVLGGWLLGVAWVAYIGAIWVRLSKGAATKELS